MTGQSSHTAYKGNTPGVRDKEAPLSLSLCTCEGSVWTVLEGSVFVHLAVRGPVRSPCGQMIEGSVTCAPVGAVCGQALHRQQPVWFEVPL